MTWRSGGGWGALADSATPGPWPAGERLGAAQATIATNAAPTVAREANPRMASSALGRESTLPNVTDGLERRVGLEDHLHQAEVLLVGVWSHQALHLGLQHVINGETQRDSRQWTGPGRITGGNRLGGQLGAADVQVADHDHQVTAPLALRQLLDPRLRGQVHGP